MKHSQLKKIYFIGGSPCSGKSTIAEKMSATYGLSYFKVDDYLENYVKKGEQSGKEICTRQSHMSPEQIWMRPPVLQNEEELQFYREIFEFILKDLENMDSLNGIITEGAAFLPELMQKIDVDQKHYVNITPTVEFQCVHYRERPWVPYVLQECSDKEKAFSNWMERDALFAEYVRNQAERMGYQTFQIDGKKGSEEIELLVSQIFGL